MHGCRKLDRQFYWSIVEDGTEFELRHALMFSSSALVRFEHNGGTARVKPRRVGGVADIDADWLVRLARGF